MIFSRHSRLGFVHIPKTGGDSITAALRRALVNPVEFAYYHKHHPLRWARRDLLGKEFDEITWLAVRRCPVEILASYYAHTCWHYHNCPNPGDVTADWINERETVAKQSFDQYVNSWLCPNKLSKGGFLKTYTCDFDGSPFPNVKLIDFDNLAVEFSNFCNEPLPQLNSTKGQKPIVSNATRAKILRYCYADVG